MTKTNYQGSIIMRNLESETLKTNAALRVVAASAHVPKGALEAAEAYLIDLLKVKPVSLEIPEHVQLMEESLNSAQEMIASLRRQITNQDTRDNSQCALIKQLEIENAALRADCLSYEASRKWNHLSGWKSPSSDTSTDQTD